MRVLLFLLLVFVAIVLVAPFLVAIIPRYYQRYCDCVFDLTERWLP